MVEHRSGRKGEHGNTGGKVKKINLNDRYHIQRRRAAMRASKHVAKLRGSKKK